MIKRQGFTLAEALITLVLISLVMAATMPIVMKTKNSASETPFRWVSRGDVGEYYSIYSSLGNSSTVVLGSQRVPIDQSIASADRLSVFSSKINPKLSIVGRNRTSSPLVSRHLIDFYVQRDNGSGGTHNIGVGNVSFDDYLNLAFGLNNLSAMKNPQTITYDSAWPNLPRTTISLVAVDAAGTSHSQNFSYGLKNTTKSGSTTTVIESGVANTAVGSYAMGRSVADNYYTSTSPPRNIIGVGNTGLGFYSLRAITTGSANTGIGAQTFYGTTTGNYNTAFGDRALYSLLSGNFNTALGVVAMYAATSALDNTAVGYQSLRYLTTGSGNTSLGVNSLYNLKTGVYNTAIGYSYKTGTANSYNVLMGRMDTAATITTTIGNGNVMANSNNQPPKITDGNYNILFGSHIQNSEDYDSDFDILLGFGAAPYYGGNISICTTNPCYASNGGIALGKYANNGITKNNVAVLGIGGHVASADNQTRAQQFISGCMDTSSSNTLYINSGITLAPPYLSLSARTVQFGLGDAAETFIKGAAYIVNDSGVVSQIATIDDLVNMLKDSTANGVKLYFNPVISPMYSDARLKNITGDNTAGLKEILQLKVKNYTFKRDKKKEPLVGVIAQDLQKVFPNSVVEGRDGYLKIKRDEIFYACVNAIKELADMFKEIIAKISGIEEKIRVLEENNNSIEEKISAIERQNKLYKERISVLEKLKNQKLEQIEKQKQEQEQAVKEEDIKNIEAEKTKTVEKEKVQQ